ncbi:diacylglycerol kinase family protein [Corynebacterium choanae]|uniref:Diacylglycerol kinase n=1 Tax=Corynebacterium choanae TaxID=1862358 RepID=A0A3G6JD65_9CORY|nr:diacylglycerol kinase family protein [Corynebacterium choanae]AZA14094.1 Diacylglycerol kinase [Corynebacterium choanae]
MPDYPIGYEPIGTVALLTNPRSGYGSARHTTDVALQRLQRRGVEAIAFNAASAADTGRLIQRALDDLDFDAIVVCGGDGMINRALQESATTGIPLGIIPAGSGNDTARHLRIPFDPVMAADVIAEGFVTTTDLGLVSNDAGEQAYFGSVLSCGVDSYMAERASNMSWAPGPNKFTLAFMQGLLKMKPNRYHIELRGAQEIPHLSEEARQRRLDLDGPISPEGLLTIDRDLLIATVGNTRMYGGGRTICPRADHHDGLLDLTMTQLVALHKQIRMVNEFLNGDHNPISWLTSYRFREARIEVDLGVQAHGDGEPLFYAPINVKCVPAAGRYIVPAP